MRQMVWLLTLMLTLAISASTATAQTSANTPYPVKVRYDAPQDQKLAGWADFLKSGHLLEDMAKEINSQIKLPKTLTLVGRLCGEANTFFQPSRQSLHHELGHALVDVLNLPITGREEDAVDQLATFVVADGADLEADREFLGAAARPVHQDAIREQL